MNDPFDGRVRSFVVELLDDPPPPPPFPRAREVLVGADRTAASRRPGRSDREPRLARRRQPLIAAAVFAGIVLIGAAFGVLARLGDDTGSRPAASPALEGASGVTGLTATVIDGPGTEPDRIVFGEDGTFEVTDDLRTVDSGVYTTDGNVITFESDATAHDPRTDVRWFYDPVLDVNNNACEDVVGSYTVVWQTSIRFVLRVISDACPRRNAIANGLQLELQVAKP